MSAFAPITKTASPTSAPHASCRVIMERRNDGHCSLYDTNQLDHIETNRCIGIPDPDDSMAMDDEVAQIFFSAPAVLPKRPPQRAMAPSVPGMMAKGDLDPFWPGSPRNRVYELHGRSPTSPVYSPTSPAFSAPRYCPTSPAYCPTPQDEVLQELQCSLKRKADEEVECTEDVSVEQGIAKRYKKAFHNGEVITCM